MLGGVDAAHGVEQELSAQLLRHRFKGVLLGRPQVERLLDQQRLVEEVGIGGDEGDLGAIPGEIVEREQGLEACDAAAHDDHPPTHAAESMTEIGAVPSVKTHTPTAAFHGCGS